MKCIMYICIISMVRISQWEVFLENKCSLLLKIKRLQLTVLVHIWKIHMKEFNILIWKWNYIYIKNMFTLKNDVSSKITNFQKDLLFKKHSGSWRFSILLFILWIIVSVIWYSHIWNKIPKRVCQNIWKNIF